MRFVVPRVDLRAYRPTHSATRLLTRSFCEHHGVVPVSVARGVLIIAMAEPDDSSPAAAEAKIFTGMSIEVVRATPEEIRATIVACYGGAD